MSTVSMTLERPGKPPVRASMNLADESLAAEAIGVIAEELREQAGLRTPGEARRDVLLREAREQ